MMLKKLMLPRIVPEQCKKCVVDMKGNSCYLNEELPSDPCGKKHMNKKSIKNRRTCVIFLFVDVKRNCVR